MSRENDGLPMLPPWLSESDVTDTGYEAPVQNLPHDDLIPEKKKGGRRIFGNRNPRKGPIPDPATPSPTPTPPTAPRPTNPTPSRPDPVTPAESDQWTPPRPATPIPQRDPGTHFSLPSRGTQPPAATQPTNGQGSTPGQPYSGQSPMAQQGAGPRFDMPPANGGQFSQPSVGPEAAQPGQHSGPEGAAASPFTVPPTPAVPEPRQASASLAGPSMAGTPTPVSPADPATRAPLPPAPGESHAATADPAPQAVRPPLPPSPGELDSADPTAGDPAAATTKMSTPPIPPSPGELDATGSGIIAPADPNTRWPIPPAPENASAAPQSGVPQPTPAVASVPVPNTTAAAHELLDAQLADLGGALPGPNAPAGGEATSTPQAPETGHAATDHPGTDSTNAQNPDRDGDFDQPMTPGRHRAADVPLPLPSDTPHGGPAPTAPQGPGPLPQQMPGPDAPAPGGQWMPPAPPVPGVPVWSAAPNAQVPPLGPDPRHPAGAVPPHLNPWAQPANSADNTDPDANPWSNAPMSEAAAAGLTTRHPAAPTQGQNGIPAHPQHPDAQSHWAPRPPETGGQPPATSTPGQMPWGPPNQQMHPGAPVAPAPGQPGVGGPMPWNTGGQPLVGTPGQDGSGQEQAPAYPDGHIVGEPGRPGPGMPGYGSGGVNQTPWAAPGSEQPGGYPGGPGQGSNGPLSPGQAFGVQGQAGEAGPYGSGVPGQYGAPTGQYGQAGYGGPAPQWGANGPGGHGPSLDDVQVRRAKKAPGSGWRKAVHHLSGGSINPGMSAEERRLQELVARIRQPVRGDYRIAVLSLKGGVGKTTTTMGLGSIFASIRGDRVIAVDANPDFGTLSQRVPLQTRSTVRDLLLDEHIQRYSDVRRHTSQGSSRLEVLASERDPAASEAFSEEEYRAVARILQRFYNIILTDCGTGLMHSAMAGVLDLAHSLVLISSSAIDGARSAAATLDWLSLHGHDHLVRNAVVVINLPRPGAPNVGINQLRDYFLSRCRAVHIIPYDPHLGEGAEIDLHRLSKPTKRAYVELAATVADDFIADPRRYRG
ncbi:MinD/ParA family ATP-binding protein [Nocardia sp. CDC160]|uniref:MinD/ParA family ATP-binding protein n=1 Tax=Nocardia sp. CDC160 TaxID=3112166 RepID=UPI002DBF1B1F|nr:AAA family ATPase [Nocardia sp. CDC160]MEC3913260.1 AAA family ATPase [Nocardia sp. CDC160]